MSTKLGEMVTYLRGHNNKGTQFFDHVVLQGHLTNKNHVCTDAYDHQIWQDGNLL